MKSLVRQMSLGLALALMMTAAAVAAPRHYSLTVEGLRCPLCAYSARRNLGAIDGVAEVEVDYETGKATVIMKDGAVLDEAAARAAIDSAGFELRGFEEVESLPEE